MKKGLVGIFLVGILLILPFVLAEEQAQTYSGFDRFVDNVKLFFSQGDNKVKMALEIREKEVNSALENFQNNNDDLAAKNLENARAKLLIVQERVSVNTADEVKLNTNGLITKVNGYDNLSENFETYILDEKKAHLTAVVVTEVNGKEGQTLVRDIVKNETTGQNTVRIVIDLEGGEQRIIELKGEMVQLENQIAERIIANKIVEGGEGSGQNDVAGVEVKTSADGTDDNELPTPDLNQFNPDLYDPNARAPGDTIDETYDDAEVNSGPSGEGENTLAP